MGSQTLALALVAALYPLGLLAIAFLLRADRPLPLALAFYAGAFLATMAIGAIVIFVLRNLDFDAPSSSTSRNGLRLGVGIALILLGLMVARRPKRPASDASWKDKLANPRLLSVFVVGILLYLPSATYIAAVQEVATDEASGASTFFALLVIVLIVLLLVEIPLISYAVAPAWTRARISSVEQWLDRNQQAVYASVLIFLGAAIAIPALIALL